MRRVILVWAVVLALLWAAAPHSYAQNGAGETPPAAQDTAEQDARGAALYATFCQACHGTQGQGAAEGPAFPALRYDPAQLDKALHEGAGKQEPGGIGMPAYDKVLDPEQIAAVSAYLAAQQTGTAPPLPAPRVQVGASQVAGDFAGDAQAGAVIYATSCNGCHGVEGAGRGEPAFPPLEFAGERTLQAVRQGTDSPYMPAFGAAHGGPLSDADLDNLAAYLATWTPTPEKKRDQGVAILVLFAGLAAILGVGTAIAVRQRLAPVAYPPK